jgi:galactokinase
MDLKALKQSFIGTYGGSDEDIEVFFAPGRVNLIGEHTDYNNGFVMPFSIQYGTYMLARRTADSTLKFRSANFPLTAEVCLSKSISPVGKAWVNYPLGVVAEFVKKDIPVTGMEILYSGNIPNEAGLSSSASIEMVTAVAVNTINGANINPVELVKMGQNAENEFVGMKCGIMDQFAVTLGKHACAVFLDCGTLEYDLVPFELKDYRILIMNTNKKRTLADSAYNDRRSTCEQAVEQIRKRKSIDSLGDLTWDEFMEVSAILADPVVLKRARHVVSENNRVLKAREALRTGDLIGLGNLMTESHKSLRDDYEVSCRELDILVETAHKQKGVLGSRMTGAGFGGCAITLLPRDNMEQIKQEIGKTYRENTGLTADFYVAEPSEGARKLESYN